MLIERGQLNLKEKITKYWPEYGKNGKEETTVEMILKPGWNTSVKNKSKRRWFSRLGLYDSTTRK